MAEHTTDIKSRIKALIGQGESSEVEFKSARGELFGFRQHQRRYNRAGRGGKG